MQTLRFFWLLSFCVCLPICDRIRKSGGFVTWNSLGQPHVNGRLAMTRSIGDFDLKNVGVIAEPETRRISVSVLCGGCTAETGVMIKCFSWSVFNWVTLLFCTVTSCTRLLPRTYHRRHQLHYEQPGDLWRHKPVPRPQRGSTTHLWTGMDLSYSEAGRCGH